MLDSVVTRRRFVQATAAALAAAPLLAGSSPLLAADEPVNSLAGRLYKTLKIGMTAKISGSLADKFQAAKDAGFAGIELNAPGINIEEAKAAVAKTGLPIDGTVGAAHWKVRHTDPDAAVRAKALENLKNAIRETHAVGGHTALLVVGRGSDGTEQECWERSIESIAPALRLAAELGVVIAIENVWNQFCYDHEGDAQQTADKFVRYVDEFNSPWVGMQFDIGNHWKYGSMGDWIRALGKRVVKLDVKGFSRKENKFTDIGEGDIDFADVRKALREINFYGWCAAEVGGGDAERLRLVSSQMDRVFGLKA